MAGQRKVAVYVTVGGVTYAPGDDVPAQVVEQVDAQGVFEGDTGPSRYEGMKVAELKAEAAARNEGRADADQVPVDGSKADLVAALEADDAK